jgi:hypothetical protein
MKKLLLLLLLVMPVSAFGMTGNELLKVCDKIEADMAGGSEKFSAVDIDNTAVCRAFIDGVNAANLEWWDAIPRVPATAPNYCFPPGVSNAQSIRIVIKYLRDHPEKLHFKAPSLINAAWKEALPCTKPSN